MDICISTKFDVGQKVWTIMRREVSMVQGATKLEVCEATIERINVSISVERDGSSTPKEVYTIKEMGDFKPFWSGVLPDALYLTREEAEDVLFEIEEETNEYLSKKPHFRSFKD